MIQDATFIHSDPGHENADKARENKAKKEEQDEHWEKKVANHTLGINFIA